MSTRAATVEVPAVRPRERRSAFTGAWMLSGAMAASGLLIYAFHVLAARSLGPDSYGQIAVLWAAMFLAVIVLFRPIEQTTSRALADRLSRQEEISSVLRSVLTLSTAILILILLLAFVGHSEIADRLFVGDGTMAALLVAGIAFYGAAYVARGVLAGMGWFAGYGLGLMADAVARLALAIPLIFIASRSIAAAAVVGAGLAGAVVPLVFGRRRLTALLSEGRRAQRFRLGTTLTFAGSASVIAAADQLLINGGPLLVMLEGGRDASRTAGIVFAATMLVRVPVYLFQGLAASLLPNLTLLQADEDGAAFRRAVLQTVCVLLAIGAAIVTFAATLGPQALGVLYGSNFVVGRTELALLGAGVGCYLAAATFSQALLARDRGARAAAAWALSAAVFVGLFLILPGDELARISVAFAVSALLDLALLAGLLTGRPPR